jgi:chemotaxis protein methyltransferase WspC
MGENLDRLRDYVGRHAALDPALLAAPSFAWLVDGRIGQLGLRDAVDYLDVVRQSAAEMEILVEGIAVQETWLFRYPPSFELLAGWLQQRRRHGTTRGPLRMLSVGCATGEEPCSMAITAAHAGWPAGEIAIDAVDRNPRSVAAAQRGHFGLRSVRPDLPPWARSWLSMDDERVDVDRTLAARVRYLHGDVFRWLGAGSIDSPLAERDVAETAVDQPPELRAPPISVPYDVVFCRNVLIYLTHEAGVRLLRALACRLAHAGLLFVGHAEAWLAPPDLLVPLEAAHTFAFHRAGPQLAPPSSAVPPPRATSHDQAGRRGQERVPTPLDSESYDDAGASAARQPDADDAGGPTAAERATWDRPDPAVVEKSTAAAPTLAKARQLADRGELTAALAAVETLLASGEPNLQLLELLGSLQLALGRLEVARDSFRRVIYLDPNHAEALLHLSLISQRLGDKDQAARYRHRAERAHHGATTH